MLDRVHSLSVKANENIQFHCILGPPEAFFVFKAVTNIYKQVPIRLDDPRAKQIVADLHPGC